MTLGFSASATRPRTLAEMAEVAELLLQSWGFVSAGSLPPTNLLKALISKVCLPRHRQPALIPQQNISMTVSATWHTRPSQLLGYGILTFSILVKLPQVGTRPKL